MRETNEIDLRSKYVANLIQNKPDASFLDQSAAAAEELGKLFMSLGLWEAQIMAWHIAMLARGSEGAKGDCNRFVEIGTLTGHSALWILNAMSVGGKLWTFEKDPVIAEGAKELLSAYAKRLGNKSVEVIVGDAVQTLPSIESHGPFDGIFIDGNKNAYPAYLDWAERHIRKGGLIIGDNVFLGGAVYGKGPEGRGFSDKQVKAMRDFNSRLMDANKYQSVLIPTGEGLLVARKI